MIKFIYCQAPHASRKNNLRGQIVQDIGDTLPPARRPSSLPESLGILWDLLEWCWTVNPEERPNAASVMASHRQWHKVMKRDVLEPESMHRASSIDSTKDDLNKTDRDASTLSSKSRLGMTHVEPENIRKSFMAGTSYPTVTPSLKAKCSRRRGRQ